MTLLMPMLPEPGVLGFSHSSSRDAHVDDAGRVIPKDGHVDYAGRVVTSEGRVDAEGQWHPA